MKYKIFVDGMQLHLIALCNGNWNIYANENYVYYIDKHGSGAHSGVYSATYKFKSTLIHNARVKKNNSIIPNDWDIIDHVFFKKLGIV